MSKAYDFKSVRVIWALNKLAGTLSNPSLRTTWAEYLSSSSPTCNRHNSFQYLSVTCTLTIPMWSSCIISIIIIFLTYAGQAPLAENEEGHSYNAEGKELKPFKDGHSTHTNKHAQVAPYCANLPSCGHLWSADTFRRYIHWLKMKKKNRLWQTDVHIKVYIKWLILKSTSETSPIQTCDPVWVLISTVSKLRLQSTVY